MFTVQTLPSSVTTVQPSSLINEDFLHVPILIIGSMVKTIPGTNSAQFFFSKMFYIRFFKWNIWKKRNWYAIGPNGFTIEPMINMGT